MKFQISLSNFFTIFNFIVQNILKFGCRFGYGILINSYIDLVDITNRRLHTSVCCNSNRKWAATNIK